MWPPSPKCRKSYDKGKETCRSAVSSFIAPAPKLASNYYPQSESENTSERVCSSHSLSVAIQKNLSRLWNISLMTSVDNEMAAWYYRPGQLVWGLTQHCPVLLHHKEEGAVGANWNIFRKQNLINNLYLFLSKVIIHCLVWNTNSAEQDCMKKASI